jgi:Domain of unknown function (DUF4383)
MAADPSVKAKEPIGPEQQADEAATTPFVVWASRLAVYFLAQGGILLLSYAYYGFKTDPHSFPLGFRLDPIHAAVHFVWGLIGTYIGFFQPRYATAFVLAFAVFYTVMAVLGTFTPYHFGKPVPLVLGPAGLGHRTLWVMARALSELIGSPAASFGRLVAAYSRAVVCRASVAIVPETPLP